MGTEPKKPWGPEDDQKKPFTPQERRNEDVKWKEHDMPDEDRDVNKADPEHDYERADNARFFAYELCQMLEIPLPQYK